MSRYDAVAPYGQSNFNESQQLVNKDSYPMSPKKRTSNWIKFGVPVAVIVIIGAVVGGILGTRSSKNKSNSSSSEAAAESAASAKAQIGIFPTATNSQYLVPIYPSTTATAAFGKPTFVTTNDAALTWPEDTFKPATPTPTNVRPDRPRLIAPGYKWAALPELIKKDPYLKTWNDTIFGNATRYAALPPVAYFMDGPSGILDNAREIKMRIKAFAYAYRMTNDTKWVDRAWGELQNAVSPDFGPAAPEDKWNPEHFLDTAELTAAFAIAYDWLYDIWTADQRNTIRSNMITYGLNLGDAAYDDARDTRATGWWRRGTFGNWNCVCNGGLTMGALAIFGDDDTGVASRLLGLTVDNARSNCAMAPSSDGTWNETANYWYFGTTGHAEMSSSLLTATGSDYGLLKTNPGFALTGDFYMHVYGPTTLFDWGDHGPNKFSTTANGVFLYSTEFNRPEFALFQRDRHDAAEPWSMFWYNPAVAGAFWNDLALDHSFDDPGDQWVAMRSSWTDMNALYVAMKAGKNQGHQTHNDLDAGDFVLDALGVRWAGEFGSADYRSAGYFAGDGQDSQRWLYYRKRTEGQNTIVVSQANQKVEAAPVFTYQSSGTTQGASTIFTPPQDSTAFWHADLTSAYDNVTSFRRGVRMINGRKQVLIQDEINAQGGIEWRMHTNATVTISGTTATLTIGDKTLTLEILNPPTGVELTTTTPTRYSTDPSTPADSPDPANPGVTVVVIRLPEGTYNLQVLFTPHWDGDAQSSLRKPDFVPFDQWSLTSHP